MFRPTTALGGPPHIGSLSIGRRLLLALACLIAYAAAAAVLHAMPSVFEVRP